MKFAGQEINIVNIREIIIRRKDTEFKFILGPVDMDKYEEFYPMPKKKKVLKPGTKIWVEVGNDPKYNAAIDERNKKMADWILLQSIALTKELEFETINWADPETWGNWRQELLKAGFTSIECSKIMREAMIANSLADDAIDKAEEDFLPGENQQNQEESDQTEEQSNT